MHTWIDIATLTKKRNAQRRFAARCRANLLLCLKPGLQVAFVPPVLDAPRNARILDVTITGETTCDITFEYLDGLGQSAAEDRLVGCHCLVMRSEVDIQSIQGETDSLAGFEVFDKQAGFVGIVKEEVHNPGQSHLVVMREDNKTGEGKADAKNSEVLIPHVPAIVIEVDAESKTLRTELPAGLLDL